ncbi:hypothetical protein C3B44_07865 [Corynebacterium yudongzhengii]|uniref:GAP family protein n=1 Tax=Corynebacterium yudongzhengii TaxID=2080740 RepID=A0A2U1T8A0_9CORY|nr:hypothetical protein [Corynebacterium yudongzhengii]AWB83008.1 hypothetical protein C3B44_07865 [Corynebacterium yudongzhengii]PWC02118.1 hypothetical protein DF222_04515 [Corynebacterium yudongzhengii]
MLSAVSFALIDSVNALLIAVVVAIGIILPKGAYRKVAPLLIAGDWLGVFLLAILVMFVFDGLEDFVTRLVDGPVFGLILIAVGLVALIGTWRAKPGGNRKIINTILSFVRTPSIWTVVAGFVLGAVQSLTSGPFFAGIAVLSAGDYSVAARYGGMLWYASLALSLPTLVALAVGLVRRYPHSRLGQWFQKARDNSEAVSRMGGYLVAAVLIVLGVVHL